MTLLIQYTFIFATVLFLGAVSGCISERSGVMNLAVEGIMIVGAAVGALILRASVNIAPLLAVILSVLASILAGALYSQILAFACVRLKADQTLVGTAMNILASAFIVVLVKSINITEDLGSSAIVSYIRQKRYFTFNVFGAELSIFLIIAIVILAVIMFVLYKTRFGLRLRACGENPEAASSVGIHVHDLRHIAVTLSGAAGGLAGFAYVATGATEWNFEVGVLGFGFLALAVMIFGQWKPSMIAIGAVVFAFFRALGSVRGGIQFLEALNLPGPVYNMMPYIICLLILTLASGRRTAPQALGEPY